MGEDCLEEVQRMAIDECFRTHGYSISEPDHNQSCECWTMGLLDLTPDACTKCQGPENECQRLPTWGHNFEIYKKACIPPAREHEVKVKLGHGLDAKKLIINVSIGALAAF